MSNLELCNTLNELLTNDTFSHSMFFQLVYMADDNGEIKITYRNLSKLLNVNLKKVHTTISKLEDKKLISWVKKSNQKGVPSIIKINYITND